MTITPSPAAVADVQAGNDFCCILTPAMMATTGNLKTLDARTRFWLGFVSGLAGIIAGDTSATDAQVILKASLNALQDVSLDDQRSLH